MPPTWENWCRQTTIQTQERRHLSDATIIAKLDALDVVSMTRNAVANGGLVLPMTLAGRLGLADLVERNVHLGDAPGHANVGQKAMVLVASALVGGDCIDDADVLRTGRSDAVLGTWVPAPSTLGTFLRSFSWADARSLDKVAGELLRRAWSAGAAPGTALSPSTSTRAFVRLTALKQGARFGYTSVRGFHPLLATAAGTGDVLGVRQRGGSAHTARGAASFLAEVFNRVRAAGATGELTLRADSGFYSHKVTGACQRAGVRFSITAKLYPPLRKVIEAVPEDQWVPVPYWAEGGADVAETTYKPFGRAEQMRLIVRRVKPTPGSQLALFAKYEYHPLSPTGKGHARAGGRPPPPRRSGARDQGPERWAVGAHALWALRGQCGLARPRCRRPQPGPLERKARQDNRRVGPIVLATLRRRYISVPGHLSRSGRRSTLHLIKDWPWAKAFLVALAALRAVAPLLA